MKGYESFSKEELAEVLPPNAVSDLHDFGVTSMTLVAYLEYSKGLDSMSSPVQIETQGENPFSDENMYIRITIQRITEEDFMGDEEDE